MRISSFRGYFVNFLGLGTFLEILFKFQRPNYKNWDHGLIYKKSRDLFAIFPEIMKSWNCF
jgi:hypothetical protein